MATKPGLVYQHNLTNEIATLTTINRELPDSPVFPVLWDHGKLGDGRVFLVMSLFDEWPLATTIGPERQPERLVAHLRTSISVADALTDLHRLQIFYVDLNPMNILYRLESGGPVIRIVDLESAYEVARHTAGVFYNPPTTSGFSAPEVQKQAPDARSDVYSLGAVLYTLLTGYGWTWESQLWERIAADTDIDADLRTILQTASSAGSGTPLSIDGGPARRARRLSRSDLAGAFLVAPVKQPLHCIAMRQSCVCTNLAMPRRVTS